MFGSDLIQVDKPCKTGDKEEPRNAAVEVDDAEEEDNSGGQVHPVKNITITICSGSSADLSNVLQNSSIKQSMWKSDGG